MVEFFYRWLFFNTLKKLLPLLLALTFAGCTAPVETDHMRASSGAAESAAASSVASSTMKAHPAASTASSSAAADTTYQDYSPYRSLSGSVYGLFFYSSWSPFAVRTDAHLRSLSEGHPLEYPVFKVDFEQFADLAKRFGVTREDAIIVIGSDGEKIRTILHPSKDELKLLLE